MSNLVTVRDNHLTCKGVHVVQYGDTQEQLMSLLQQGYQLTYYLENPPEEGKLTLSKPNDDSITGGCVNPCGHLELRLTLSSDQIPDNLTDYYNVLYPPDFNGPRGTADVYSADVRAFMQNILTAYTTLLREYELNPPETTPDITDTTDTTTDPNNWADGPTFTVNWPESTDTTPKEYKLVLVDGEPLKLVPLVDSDTTNLNYLEGTINGRPIAGYHLVQYGETQEYLESLNKAGVMLVYREDNPPEEGKFTLTKPNPDPAPGTITVSPVANPVEIVVTGNTSTTSGAYPISMNNVTFVVNPDRNLPDHLICTVKKDDDLPSGYVFTTEYTEEFEEKLKKAIELYFNTPIRRDPDDTRVAFISTVDAETEAITSVQVACAEDGGWRTIGTLNNPGGIDWKYQAGNLTGSGTASVVWHAQELGALGVWTDGTDNWTAIDGWFDENWTMLGCGDFDGDGKDSVLMSLYGGLFYSVDLDGTLSSLGDLNWSGWEFGAVGDFAGDGRDDVVLLHRESGTVVLLADGNADSFERLGQLASDWNIAGAGDFDADGKDDLVVQQTSTGIAGAYASADMSKWSTVTSDYLLA